MIICYESRYDQPGIPLIHYMQRTITKILGFTLLIRVKCRKWKFLDINRHNGQMMQWPFDGVGQKMGNCGLIQSGFIHKYIIHCIDYLYYVTTVLCPRSIFIKSTSSYCAKSMLLDGKGMLCHEQSSLQSVAYHLQQMSNPSLNVFSKPPPKKEELINEGVEVKQMLTALEVTWHTWTC